MVTSRFFSRLLHRQTPPPHDNNVDQPEPASDSSSSSVMPSTTPFSPPPLNSFIYWKRAVLESPGIDISTCQINGPSNDPNSFPTLPTTYRSLSSVLRSDGSAQNVHHQSQSPFFLRLPPEVRHIIYLFAFGARRVHFDFTFQSNPGSWIWWHRVCDNEQHCPDKQFVCPENAGAEYSMLTLGSTAWVKPGFEYKVDAMAWLKCCKMGYQECLSVLYNSNTFVLTQGIDQLFRLSRAMPVDHLALMTSLHTEIDVYRCSKGAPNMTPEFQAFYNGFFDIFHRCLPNLKSLHLSIAGLPKRRQPVVEWPEDCGWLWIRPWEELAQSRDWKKLEIGVSETWYEDFQTIVGRSSQLDDSKRYRLLKGAGQYPRGW